MKAYVVFIGVLVVVGATFVIVDMLEEDANNELTAPTSAAIEEFVNDEEIEPINIERNQTRHIFVSANAVHVIAEDEVTGDVSVAGSSWSGQSDISLGASTTGTPYLYIVFNDDDVYEQAEVIDISIDNGKVTNEINPDEKGMTLLYGESMIKDAYSFYHITVYDSDREKLYETRMTLN